VGGRDKILKGGNMLKKYDDWEEEYEEEDEDEEWEDEEYEDEEYEDDEEYDEWDDDDYEEFEEDEEWEDEEYEDDEEAEEDWVESASFVCEDCNYRWTEEDDEAEVIVCPMCGSDNITQI
jgi:hypothetical protein